MRYRRKPPEVRAIRYDGTNITEIRDFIGKDFLYVWPTIGGELLFIRTRDGVVPASPGDFIVRDGNGSHYPVDPEHFLSEYERIH